MVTPYPTRSCSLKKSMCSDDDQNNIVPYEPIKFEHESIKEREREKEKMVVRHKQTQSKRIDEMNDSNHDHMAIVFE